MATRILLRGGTAAEWAAANPVLAKREPGVETDTGKAKYGDGVKTWSQLPYAVKEGPAGPAGPAATLTIGTVETVPGSVLDADVVAAQISTPGTPANDALRGGFVAYAPKPVGTQTADTAAIQGLMNALESTGGGAVHLHPGTYVVTGLEVPSKVALLGSTEGATVIKLGNGVNKPVIASKGFAGFSVARNTFSTLDGVPHGIRIENLRIDGTRGGNTSANAHGLALWAMRTIVRNVYIYSTKGKGFYSDGIVGSTGGYPNGQVENIFENIWINGCEGTGFYHVGPHDGYADKIYVYGDLYGTGLANCAEIGDLDVGYMHVYGGRVGVVLKGNARFDHLQTENNTREGLVSETLGSQTNSIGRLTAYGNWAQGVPTSSVPTQTDYSIRIENRVDIRDAMIRVDNGESGLLISGSAAAGTTIGGGKLVGTNAANRLGMVVNANRLDVNLQIENWSTAWSRYGNNSYFRIRSTNCNIGYYEPDATGSGSTIEFLFAATGTNQVPWALPVTLPNNTYRLSSTGVVNWKMSHDGLSDGQLTNGEVTSRFPISSSVALVSGTMQLTYFVAKRNIAVSTVELNTGGAAAGATPTLCRVGVYSVAANGDLTLVASSANDTALFGSTFSTATKALSSAWTPIPGQRYAFAILVVSTATMPQFYGNQNLPGGPSSRAPRLTGQVSGLTDMPTTVAAGSVSASSKAFYAAIV